MGRPRVSVVVPFGGAPHEAGALASALAELDLGPDDEVVVADNGPLPSRPPLPARARLVAAPARRSSYYARNVGAAAADGEWILFLDADCRPPATLLDDYFREPVAERHGLLAGEVEGVGAETGLAARYLVARRHLEVAPHLTKGPHPAGVTANLMVRREAWAELGGFHEVRSGADLEFCWRAAEAGWELEYRPEAKVGHVHTGQLRPALQRAWRYGAGQAWLNRAYPGSSPPPRAARQLGRALGGSVVWTATARFERARFKALDGLWESAFAAGYRWGDNQP